MRGRVCSRQEELENFFENNGKTNRSNLVRVTNRESSDMSGRLLTENDSEFACRCAVDLGSVLKGRERDSTRAAHLQSCGADWLAAK